MHVRIRGVARIRLDDPLAQYFPEIDTDATLPGPFSSGYRYGTAWDDPSPPAPPPEPIDVTNFKSAVGFRGR